MNIVLSLLLSALVSYVTPAMILSLLAELVEFLDPIMAKRGFIQRQIWGMFKSQLTSPAIGQEIAKILADIEVKLAAAKAEQKIAPDYSPL